MADDAIEGTGGLDSDPLTRPLDKREIRLMDSWLSPTGSGGIPTYESLHQFVFNLWRWRRAAVDCSIFRAKAEERCRAMHPDWPPEELSDFIRVTLGQATAILAFLQTMERWNWLHLLNRLHPVEFFSIGYSVARNLPIDSPAEAMDDLLAEVAAGDTTLISTDAEIRIALGPMDSEQAATATAGGTQARRNEREVAEQVLSVLNRGQKP